MPPGSDPDPPGSPRRRGPGRADPGEADPGEADFAKLDAALSSALADQVADRLPGAAGPPPAATTTGDVPAPGSEGHLFAPGTEADLAVFVHLARRPSPAERDRLGRMGLAGVGRATIVTATLSARQVAALSHDDVVSQLRLSERLDPIGRTRRRPPRPSL